MAKARVSAKNGDAMQDICRYISAHADEQLRLNELAAKAQLSPAHFQRRFKAAIGVSPKEYQESCRLKTLKTRLHGKASVTEAIYDAGFTSPSRVYSRNDTRLGMTPRQYRAGGKEQNISYAASQTPLGLLMIGATDRGICFIQFGDSAEDLRAELQREFPAATLAPMDETAKDPFRAWMENLSGYLAGSAGLSALPLDIRGTAFQMKVWKYLQKIPSGGVCTYTDVARAIGRPDAVRAVAGAIAANRVAIAVPCHRVIRSDGALSGYRWGPKRKQRLLDIEKNEHP